MPTLIGHGDRYARALMGVLVIVAVCVTGYLVGRVNGVHEERRRAWRECTERLDVVSQRMALVRLADPCERTPR